MASSPSPRADLGVRLSASRKRRPPWFKKFRTHPLDEVLRKSKVMGVQLLALLLRIYSYVLLVSVIGSWFNTSNPVFEFANRLTEPVLEPVRKVLPPAGGFDLSPMLVFFVLQLLSGMLMGSGGY